MASLRAALKKGLPAGLMRRLRRFRKTCGWGLAGWRGVLLVQPRIWRWRPRADWPREERASVHLLCGEPQAAMAAWAAASLCHHSQRRWPVWFHDDGTLTPRTTRALAALFPDGQVVPRRQADEAARSRLAGWPGLARLRAGNIFGCRITDMPDAAPRDRLLLLDSDVLFFAPPTEILAWLKAPAPPPLWYNRDCGEWLVLPAAQLREAIGLAPAPAFNTGLLCLPKAAADLAFLEDCIARAEILGGSHWFAEQTLFALLAARWDRGGPLGPRYELSLEPARRPDAISRHYVSPVRRQYFTEGLRDLAAQLGLA